MAGTPKTSAWLRTLARAAADAIRADLAARIAPGLPAPALEPEAGELPGRTGEMARVPQPSVVDRRPHPPLEIERISFSPVDGWTLEEATVLDWDPAEMVPWSVPELRWVAEDLYALSDPETVITAACFA